MDNGMLHMFNSISLEISIGSNVTLRKLRDIIIVAWEQRAGLGVRSAHHVAHNKSCCTPWELLLQI